LQSRLPISCKAVEDAPESIQDVKSELQGVNNILEQIKTPIENQPDSIPPETVADVAKNAKDCTRVFTQLNKLIDRLGCPNSKEAEILVCLLWGQYHRGTKFSASAEIVTQSDPPVGSQVRPFGQQAVLYTSASHLESARVLMEHRKRSNT
jgi:hypothetical protein